MLGHAFLGDDLLECFCRSAVEVAGRLLGRHPLPAAHLMEFAGGVRQALGRLGQRRSDPRQSCGLVAAQGISSLLQSSPRRPHHLRNLQVLVLLVHYWHLRASPPWRLGGY